MARINQILLNSYFPPRGSAPAMEEVIIPGPKDIKHVIHGWKPFNQGESAADRLDNLYPRTLRIPVAAWPVDWAKSTLLTSPLVL